MDPDDLLAPSVLARLERVQLATRRKLAGRFAGEHRSPAFGSSVDFSDYRDYHPGDDFRRIDYPLYARTGNLFIRLFEAEEDLTVRLLVDRSASMGLYGKLDQAVRLAAAIGFVALVNRDTVQLFTEPSSGPAHRFSGRHAAHALFRSLAALEAAGPTELDERARTVAGQRGPAGMSVVISDLLTTTSAAAVDRLLGSGADVSVVHVVAPAERDPDLHGDLEMVDVETGEAVPASLSPSTLDAYRAQFTEWLDATATLCRGRGAAYARVDTTDDVGDVLLRGWRELGLVR